MACPPSRLSPTKTTTPAVVLRTGVWRGAKMSTPSCRLPPLRGAPNVSATSTGRTREMGMGSCAGSPLKQRGRPQHSTLSQGRSIQTRGAARAAARRHLFLKAFILRLPSPALVAALPGWKLFSNPCGGYQSSLRPTAQKGAGSPTVGRCPQRPGVHRGRRREGPILP